MLDQEYDPMLDQILDNWQMFDQAADGSISPFCCEQLMPSMLAATSVLLDVQQQQVYQHQHHQPQQLALIMELMEGGSLAQRIYSTTKRRLTYLEVGTGTTFIPNQ